jgi:tetratricopeptide (TPR) repeat protein
LASLYRAQGKFELAEGLFNEALSVRTLKRGPRHRDTLQLRDHLATLYLRRGDFDRAEAMYKDVLEARVATRGADHPETLITKYNLATLYRWCGKFEAAEAAYKEVLSVYTATIGADHPYALAIRHDLATIYVHHGDDVRAEMLFKEVLAAWTAKLGPDHPNTLTTLYSPAELYHWQRREHARAEPMYKEVLAGRSAWLGPDHIDTIATRKSLAELYRNLGQFDLAEALLKEVLASRTIHLGGDHTDTLYAQHELVILYRWMKAFDRAIPLAEDLVRRGKASDPVATRRMRAELGAVYFDAGRFSDAISYLEEVHREASKDPTLNWVGNTLLNAYVGVGNTNATVALALEQARVARERFPADSLELAAAVQAPGEALMQVQAFTDAEPLLLMGFKGLRQAQAADPDRVDPPLQDAITRLVRLYEAWGKPDAAAKWRQVPERP